MGFSIDMLNTIRVNASPEYMERVPEATQYNMGEVGAALATYTTLANEFVGALFNKIGKTIIEAKLFNNKLARFKSGTIANHQDVEEIFIQMAKAEGAYNPAGPNPLGRRELPDIKTIYHRENRRDVYTVSIGDIDFIRVFRSEATLDSFISGLFNSIYSGANYDEWLHMKSLMVHYSLTSLFGPMAENDNKIDNALAYQTLNFASTDNKELWAKNFVKTVRKAITDMSFVSDQFNLAHVKTWTNPEDLVLFVNKDVVSEVDVEVLAKAFNMGKTDIQTEIVVMDDFDTESIPSIGEAAPVYALLADKEFFRVFDTLSHFEPQRNAEGLFTNYFYHVQQILSYSTFKNAVWITGKIEA